jgi:hypothetical protein
LADEDHVDPTLAMRAVHRQRRIEHALAIPAGERRGAELTGCSDGVTAGLKCCATTNSTATSRE